MKNSKFKKFLALLLAFIMLTIGKVSALSQPLLDEAERVALAYHSITFEKLGEIHDLSYNKSNDELTFTLGDNFYNFPIKLYSGDLLVKEKLQNSTVYYGENNGLKCSITEYAGNICINISPKHALTSAAISNKNEYLIVLIGNRNEIQQSFTQVTASQTSQTIKSNNIQICTNNTLLSTSRTAKTSGRSLHVLAQGSFSIPFFVSTGVSEAWATSEHAYSNMYRVNLYQYLVLTALPGDGITLYSRYYTQPALSVWSSPAWPPAGLQSVNVVAELDVREAKLEAYTHYTALGGKVPILVPVYDTCDIA